MTFYNDKECVLTPCTISMAENIPNKNIIEYTSCSTKTKYLRIFYHLKSHRENWEKTFRSVLHSWDKLRTKKGSIHGVFCSWEGVQTVTKIQVGLETMKACMRSARGSPFKTSGKEKLQATVFLRQRKM